LKIKFNDFQQITRAMSLDHLFGSEMELREVLLGLLQKEWPLDKPVRLVGAQLSGLVHCADSVNTGEGDSVTDVRVDYPAQYPLGF
jgi:DNA polymerase-4